MNVLARTSNNLSEVQKCYDNIPKSVAARFCDVLVKLKGEAIPVTGREGP
jgi:hypothetical protein